MPKRAVFERSRRDLSLDVSVGVHTRLVVEQSSLESQSRVCVPRLRCLRVIGLLDTEDTYCRLYQHFSHLHPAHGRQSAYVVRYLLYRLTKCYCINVVCATGIIVLLCRTNEKHLHTAGTFNMP